MEVSVVATSVDSGVNLINSLFDRQARVGLESGRFKLPRHSTHTSSRRVPLIQLSSSNPSAQMNRSIINPSNLQFRLILPPITSTNRSISFSISLGMGKSLIIRKSISRRMVFILTSPLVLTWVD